MSTYTASAARPVAELDISARATFILRTYAHLFGAIAAFTLIEAALFTSGMAAGIARAMLGTTWLLWLGLFMVVGHIATRTAHRSRSLATQYLALGGFVLAEALIFVPLLTIAEQYAPGTIAPAAAVTLGGFAGLTTIAFMTRKDFSFLGGVLKWGMLVALGAIVAALIFGFSLGTFFSVIMVALAGGYILYDTSQVMHHHPEERYVGASLELFASVALMFWYVLRLFIASRD